MNDQVLGQSRLGQDLMEATRSDFFQFFHLRVASKSKMPDGELICLRPIAPQFRDRVALYASVDRQARFLELQLSVDRSVIDDSDTERLARDIVKSFLQDATPQEDMLALRDWIVDIYYRPSLTQNHFATDEMSPDQLFELLKMQLDAGKKITTFSRAGAKEKPALPAEPTAAFEVFMGEMESCEQQLPNSKIRLSNEVVDGTSELRISVSP